MHLKGCVGLTGGVSGPVSMPYLKKIGFQNYTFRLWQATPPLSQGSRLAARDIAAAAALRLVRCCVPAYEVTVQGQAFCRAPMLPCYPIWKEAVAILVMVLSLPLLASVKLNVEAASVPP